MVQQTEICLDSLLRTGVQDYTRIPDTRREEGRLLQKCRLRGIQRSLQLFNGHYVEWQESLSGRVNSCRQINLAFIDPVPVYRRQLARERVLAGVIAALMAPVAWWVVGVPLAGVLAGLALILLATAYQRSCDRVVFRTRHGKLAVFELFCRAPNRREAEAWVDLISERSRHAGQILPAGREGLAAEMSEHRRMAAEGWLSKPRYERARKRIMAEFAACAKGGAAGTGDPSRRIATSRQNHDAVVGHYGRLAS